MDISVTFDSSADALTEMDAFFKRTHASSLLDTRVVYCDDNLEQLAKLPDACVDLIYIYD